MTVLRILVSVFRFLLSAFREPDCHIGIADGLDFCYAVLLNYIVQCREYLFKQMHNMSRWDLVADGREADDVKEDDRDAIEMVTRYFLAP